MINPRTKGATGERQICDLLNAIIQPVKLALGYPRAQVESPEHMVQRNQNQSAVGGRDLTNTHGVAFEVKRQETLSIPAWWKQCCAAAAERNEIPVLIYRQNRKAWRVVMYGHLFDGKRYIQTPVDISYQDFHVWYSNHLHNYLSNLP